MTEYSLANESDLSQVVDIFAESFAEFFEAANKKSLTKEEILDIITLYGSTGIVYIAKDTDKVAGFILSVKKISDLWKKLFSKEFINKIGLFIFTPRLMFIVPQTISFLSGGYIPVVAVDKNYRNKNIAYELVRKTVLQLSAQGVKEINICILANNAPSLRLAEKTGFIKEKIIRKGRLEWQILKLSIDSSRETILKQ